MALRDETESKYVRTYTSLVDIDTSFNVATRLDVVINAMETPSIAMYTVVAQDNAYYPIGTNKVVINKFADGQINIISEVNGIRYTKDFLTDGNGQYNNEWTMLAKIVASLNKSMTINPTTSQFSSIIKDISNYGNVIPIFTYTSLGGLTVPPQIYVNTLIEANILWLAVTNNESYAVTFNYTVILLGV